MKRKKILIILLLVAIPALGKRVNTERSTSSSLKNKVPKEWMSLLDPKTTEFWKEGNHVPDAGFLLFAKNPTNMEYAKYWLLRNEMKAKLLGVMQKTVEKAQKELIQSGELKDRYYQFKKIKRATKKIESTKISDKELKRLNFYFLFSSTCSHCKALSKKLPRIPDVRPLQVNKGKIMNFEGLLKTTKADSRTLDNYAPDGIVPVVVIHNPERNSVTKIVGNKPINEYLYASKELLKGD